MCFLHSRKTGIERDCLSLPFLLCALAWVLPANARSGQDEREPNELAVAGEEVDIYFCPASNNFVASNPPLQSDGNIKEIFEVVRKAWGVRRVLWRGLQEESLLRHGIVRAENVAVSEYWEWLRHLALKRQINRFAVQEAHRRGMKIWGYTSLFEWGAEPREAAYLSVEEGPAVQELRLRIDHREWIPTDRYGIRRQSGPLELAYPAAQKALVNLLVQETLRHGYDGLMLMTYVEVTDLWFEDEFGFSDPVVEEYQRRHGRNIRKESFDKERWYRLRGEYVTQTLRQLSEALHAKGKKLGVALDPQKPEFPQPWTGMNKSVATAGRIFMEWERWIQEGLVDEIMVGTNEGQASFCERLLKVAGDRKITISVMHPARWPKSEEKLTSRGVRRMLNGALNDLEWGSKEKQSSGLNPEDDPWKVARLLHQVETGVSTWEWEKLRKCLQSPSIVIRRQALRAIAQSGHSEAVKHIEATIEDSDHAVRCTALESLARCSGPESVERIFEAIRRHGNFQFDYEAVNTLKTIYAAQYDAVLPGLKDRDVRARRVVAEVLRKQRPNEALQRVLLEAVTDRDPWVRWLVAQGLAACPAEDPVLSALMGRLEDSHPTVRAGAAFALGELAGREKGWAPWKKKILQALCRRFEGLGHEYRGADQEWAFKAVGHALLKLGEKGPARLREWLEESKDPVLADHAWRCLYLNQDGRAWPMVSEEEALRTGRLHPKARPPAP
ncbi:MAG: HEAT repeat domain-containing protein [Verrucomicrobia bacterium]|nr:HEAT repeat domain-containing protein [Verrucomicrobiota bacterium]